MYSLELSLRYSPFPVSIQKKDYEDVMKIFNEIKYCMNDIENSTKLIELKCEKVKDKMVVVRAQEVISVQIYEKSSAAGRCKKTWFLFRHVD